MKDYEEEDTVMWIHRVTLGWEANRGISREFLLLIYRTFRAILFFMVVEFLFDCTYVTPMCKPSYDPMN